jgi:mercuric ion transport protein
MEVANEGPRVRSGSDRRDAVLGWTAVATSAGAVLAWAACCVLPMTLALAGTGMAATATLAGQRTWLTVVAALILAGAWLLAWRRVRACRMDPTCGLPSRLNLALLSGASVLLLAAVAWPSLIEPRVLRLILAARG